MVLPCRLFILLSLISFTVAHSRNIVVGDDCRTNSVSTSQQLKIPTTVTRIGLEGQSDVPIAIAIASLRGGGYLIPAGWNPFGYKITALGEKFLSLGESLVCDVGRFIASLKSSRKRRSTIKNSWLEIMRASKTSQTMRMYRSIDELLAFCLKAGLID